MNCKEGNIQIINQICLLLDNLSDEKYGKPLDLFNGSTIGQHIRHIFDFYLTIINSYDQANIDYLDRERDPNLEINSKLASRMFSALIKNIESLSDSKAIIVVTDFDPCSNNNRQEVRSSIGRELMYAYDHAVHHLAIIKMGLRTEFPEVEFDPNLGIAPSTIKYHKLISSDI